jgi:hypothetical protein
MDIVDLTMPMQPMPVAGGYDPIAEGGLPAANGDPNYLLASVGASDDGRTAYLSYQTAGLFAIDLTQVVDENVSPQIFMLTPASHSLRWAPPGIGPHAATPVPGRKLLAATEEILPDELETNCPWGHLRLVDISDPMTPAVAGELWLPEQYPGLCAGWPAQTVYTASAVTATENLALVTWYDGGLQLIDIADAEHPFQVAEFRPRPIPEVEAIDPVFGGSAVEVWGYPIIQDGLIYVVDVRNGLYILRYDGWRDGEINERRLLEGNSNLGAFLSRR